jgi:hypothetical protein
MPIGKCPDCGRTARLGKLVGELYILGTDGLQLQETIPTDERLRCRDCCFVSPMRSWKTYPECGAETPNLSSRDVCQTAERVTIEREPSQTRQRALNFLEGIELWLQTWGSRGRVLDTHAWCAKMERLNSLKVTSRQILRTTADLHLLSKRL